LSSQGVHAAATVKCCLVCQTQIKLLLIKSTTTDINYRHPLTCIRVYLCMHFIWWGIFWSIIDRRSILIDQWFVCWHKFTFINFWLTDWQTFTQYLLCIKIHKVTPMSDLHIYFCRWWICVYSFLVTLLWLQHESKNGAKRFA